MYTSSVYVLTIRGTIRFHCDDDDDIHWFSNRFYNAHYCFYRFLLLLVGTTVYGMRIFYLMLYYVIYADTRIITSYNKFNE